MPSSEELKGDRYHEFNGRDHSHYSDNVLLALSNYRSARLVYEKLGKYRFKIENTDRLDSMQAAFDTLVRARKAETGVGYYLTPEQYANKLKNDGNAG